MLFERVFFSSIGIVIEESKKAPLEKIEERKTNT